MRTPEVIEHRPWHVTTEEMILWMKDRRERLELLTQLSTYKGKSDETGKTRK